MMKSQGKEGSAALQPNSRNDGLPDAVARIAADRLRTSATRIRYGFGIAIAAMAVVPAVWPLIWLALYLPWQWLDRHLARRAARRALHPNRFLAAMLCANLHFGSLSIALWYFGGDYGLFTAGLVLTGALIYPMVYGYHDNRLFMITSAPYLGYMALAPIGVMCRVGFTPAGLAATLGVAMVAWRLYGTQWHHQHARDAAAKAQKRADLQREAAEAASRAKSKFLAIISHELRTPMNAVLGAADLLKRSPLSPADRELVAAIGESGDMLLTQINELLDYSKIEAKKLDITPDPTDLESWAASLTRAWAPRFAQKDVTFSLRFARPIGFDVEIDGHRVRQIADNLLSNALKFTEKGSVQAVIDGEAGPSGFELIFEVVDTGIGIEADRQEVIFDPFTQADATITRRYGGTGLGLAISRTLAQFMGGTLSVRSTIGEGATFTLRIPAPEAPESEAPRAHESGDALPHAVNGMSVLVVEDHQANQLVIRRFVEIAQCKAVLANNGREGVAAAAAQKFDLILMDLRMPEMDGFTAIAAIRKDGLNCDTPIVALSADVREEDRFRAERVGADSYLTKPIEPADFFDTLARYAPALRPRSDEFAA